jgi:hypothetical protein
MRPEYSAWIKANVDGDGFGFCRSYAEKMVKAFPELRVVRGHYYCVVWGQRGHWWCETEAREIVDPTAAQFPSKGAGVYDGFTGDDSELPTGRCPNCGEFCFHGKSFCSDDCGRSYVAWINAEAAR